MRTILPHTENPALREIAKPVAIADITSPFIKTLIKDMKALLKKEPQGVAIAAPQLGEALQIFVVSGEALEKRSAKSKKAFEKKNREARGR
jgi:peptide deformylase